MRSSAAAGRFYPAAADQLEEMVDEYLASADGKNDKSNVVAPHAGYVYSGQTAAFSYRSVKKAETYVILGPCHFVPSDSPAVTSQDWKTPLGRVELDRDFIVNLDGLQENDAVHAQDHAIEVQLPFLQVSQNDFKIVPIAMGDQSLQSALKLAANIDRAIKKTGRDVVVIASSDFTHFETDDRARKIDREIYEKILNMDSDSFYERAARETVCGYGPIAVAMNCQGVKTAELLNYSTSADATGDESRVVGYASIGFSEDSG